MGKIKMVFCDGWTMVMAKKREKKTMMMMTIWSGFYQVLYNVEWIIPSIFFLLWLAALIISCCVILSFLSSSSHERACVCVCFCFFCCCSVIMSLQAKWCYYFFQYKGNKCNYTLKRFYWFSNNIKSWQIKSSKMNSSLIYILWMEQTDRQAKIIIEINCVFFTSNPN